MNTEYTNRYPKIVGFVSKTGFQVTVILLSLFLLIYYNVSYYLYVPLTGVWLYYIDDTLTSVEINNLTPGSPGELAGLKQGDKVISIDGRDVSNLNIPVHYPKMAGDTEQYVVQRNSQILEIPVKIGSYFQHPEYLLPVVPDHLLSTLIYLLGVILLLLSSPTDIKSRLLGVVWILAGVAVAATGPGYTSCAWFAPETAITAFALSISFSVTAHLYFPVPTFSNRTRNAIIWGAFLLSVISTAVYLSQQFYFYTQHLHPETSISANVIRLLFYLSWLVNIGFLLKNRFFVKDNEVKRQISLIFLGTLIGILPVVLLTGLPGVLLGRSYMVMPSNVSSLSLILIPISYGYVTFQRKLLKIDLIINRALVLFLMIIFVLFASVMVIGVVSRIMNFPPQTAIIGGILCVLLTLPSTALQKHFQKLVDRALYGGYYDFTTVTSGLSNRLAETTNRDVFIEILTDELPRNMQIRKSAILLAGSDNCLDLQGQITGTFTISVPNDAVCSYLIQHSQPVRASDLWATVDLKTANAWSLFGWAQVFAPIIHGDLLGILILGDRSTGDIYSNQDLEIIKTVSQQASLSIANIRLVESLRGLAQRLVRSDEEQRRQVAQDLHDDILPNLFFLNGKLSNSNPELTPLIDSAVTKIRQIIKAQRPSHLDGGIGLAIEGLVREMKPLAGDKTIILYRNLLNEPIFLSEQQTTSIYRIVQEAMNNILKHADADEAVVTIEKELDSLMIQIEDNGIGIANIDHAPPDHYGLVGMQERAMMIGAHLDISSEFEKGTRIFLRVKLLPELLKGHL